MRILVIEDDAKIASFIERGLREDGYAVDVARDGNEGLTNALVYEYDILLVPPANTLISNDFTTFRNSMWWKLNAKLGMAPVVKGYRLHVFAPNYVDDSAGSSALRSWMYAMYQRCGAL